MKRDAPRQPTGPWRGLNLNWRECARRSISGRWHRFRGGRIVFEASGLGKPSGRPEFIWSGRIVLRGRGRKQRRMANSGSVVGLHCSVGATYHAEGRGRALPRYVEGEFEAYLKCGLLEHGFLVVKCDSCQAEKLVAYSCKRRGFCPSCGARRMVETAALLIDEVLPRQPIRQWVLSLPIALRYLLATRPEVVTQVLGIVYRAFGRLRDLVYSTRVEATQDHGGAMRIVARSVASFAERMRELDYHTYMAGKWHLGEQPGRTESAAGSCSTSPRIRARRPISPRTIRT